MTRSPVYAQFDECLEGAPVIVARGEGNLDGVSAALFDRDDPEALVPGVDTEVSVCVRNIDETQRAWFTSSAASQWLTFRLQV